MAFLKATTRTKDISHLTKLTNGWKYLFMCFIGSNKTHSMYTIHCSIQYNYNGVVSGAPKAKFSCTVHTFIHCITCITVPAVSRSCTITISYNQLSRMLLLIDSTWDSVPVSNNKTFDDLYIIYSSYLAKYTVSEVCTINASFKM